MCPPVIVCQFEFISNQNYPKTKYSSTEEEKFGNILIEIQELSEILTSSNILVFLAAFVLLSLQRVDADLFVVLLESSEILPGLGELTLLHTLSDVPKYSVLESQSGRSPQGSYQWTNARLAYIRSNLWSRRAQASAMAVVLESMQTHLGTLARSPPGTTVGGW